MTAEQIPLEVGQVRREGGKTYAILSLEADVDGYVPVRVADLSPNWYWSCRPAGELLDLPIVEPVPDPQEGDCWAHITADGRWFVTIGGRNGAAKKIAVTNDAVGIVRVGVDIDTFVPLAELEAEAKSEADTTPGPEEWRPDWLTDEWLADRHQSGQWVNVYRADGHGSMRDSLQEANSFAAASRIAMIGPDGTIYRCNGREVLG